MTSSNEPTEQQAIDRLAVWIAAIAEAIDEVAATSSEVEYAAAYGHPPAGPIQGSPLAQEDEDTAMEVATTPALVSNDELICYEEKRVTYLDPDHTLRYEETCRWSPMDGVLVESGTSYTTYDQDGRALAGGCSTPAYDGFEPRIRQGPIQASREIAEHRDGDAKILRWSL